MARMDEHIQKKLNENARNFTTALERIIDKYSHIQDDGVEVSLNEKSGTALAHCMTLGKRMISRMDSKLDLTQQDGGADETILSSNTFSVEEDGDEDQDEDLNATLRSGGSTLVDLYPSMVSQISKAWHRQHVSDAAESVRRRYLRWRQSSNRNLNKTFDISPRSAKSSQRKREVKPVLKGTQRSEPALHSPIRRATNMEDWQTHGQSPGRGRSPFTTKQHKPILIIEPSGPPTIPPVPETSKSNQISVNEMLTVSQLSPRSSSQLEELSSNITISPARFFQKITQGVQKPVSPVAGTQTTAFNERPVGHGSPARQSPLKIRLMAREGLTGSPFAFSRSPKSTFVGSCSREPNKSRLIPSSPNQKLNMPPRRLYTPESDRSVRVQPYSPQPASAASRQGLQRRRSFDSSLPSSTLSYTAKELDEELAKTFHKFVCKDKSDSSNFCSICAGRSEASRGHSSKALAALSLSPHRSILRKRQREVDHVFQPQSKHYRSESTTYSPGSRRHSTVVLRHRLLSSEAEPSHDFCHHRKQSAFQMLSRQQPSAVAQQEMWSTRGWPVSVATPFGSGCSD